MIQINLLPHREAARKRRREMFFVQLGLSVGVGVLVAGLVFGWYQAQIERQNSRNGFLRAEITKLDAQIKDVAQLQAELDGLKSRQLAVESLQADRNLPVYLLEEMVGQMPEGVFLRELKQEGLSVTLLGVAQSQERVSELLRNLGARSEWLTQPQLVEITSGTVQMSQREQRRVFNFSLRVTLAKTQDEANKPGAKPSSQKNDGQL